MKTLIIENEAIAAQAHGSVPAAVVAKEYAEALEKGLPVNAMPISGDRTAAWRDRWVGHDRMAMHVNA